MAFRLSIRRAMLLAGTLGTLPVYPALAATAARTRRRAGGRRAGRRAAPLPPGSPLIGRPNTEGAMKLAPIAPPPIPTAADKLPVDKLVVPKGFKVEVWASGIFNARTMRLGDKGTVFVSGRLNDKVHAVTDKGGKREVKVIASGMHRPNGLAFKDGTLYVAEISKVTKFEKIEDNLDNPPKGHDDLRRSAEGRGARLEVHRHRAGQQALYSGRLALQQLPGARHARADAAHQSRRQRRGSHRARHPQNGRLRLASDLQAALLHRQQPRLGFGGLSRGRAQSHHQGRRAFRQPVLPSGRLPRSGARLGTLVRRVREADRQDGPAYRRARDAVLHRQDVPGRVSQSDLRCAARLVEPDQEGRRRRRGGEAEHRTARSSRSRRS